MLQEERTDQLLKAIYNNDKLNVYDFCAEVWKNEKEILFDCKSISDKLVEEKLARYSDDKKTELSITNFGRYWVTRGGFLIYLKEGEKKIKTNQDKHHEELSEELKEARLKFTHYRIVTYWWGFALTLISFILSMLNLYLILRK